MQRLKIASISRADLLTLKLDVVNARNTLQNAESSLKRAMFSLASFLNLEKNTEIRLLLPSRPGELNIPVDAALDAARSNNPNFLGLRQDILEAEQNDRQKPRKNPASTPVSTPVSVSTRWRRNLASYNPAYAAGNGICQRLHSFSGLGSA